MAEQSHATVKKVKCYYTTEMRAPKRETKVLPSKMCAQSNPSGIKNHLDLSVDDPKKTSHISNRLKTKIPVRIHNYPSKKALPIPQVETHKFSKPESRPKMSLHHQARSIVRVSGKYSIPKIPVINNKPVTTKLKVANKEDTTNRPVVKSKTFASPKLNSRSIVRVSGKYSIPKIPVINNKPVTTKLKVANKEDTTNRPVVKSKTFASPKLNSRSIVRVSGKYSIPKIPVIYNKPVTTKLKVAKKEDTTNRPVVKSKTFASPKLNSRGIVRVGGMCGDPKTPVIYNKPVTTELKDANKEDTTNPPVVQSETFASPKPSNQNFLYHRLILDTPLFNESWKSRYESFLPIEKEIHCLEEIAGYMSEEHMLENIFNISPPASTPFKEPLSGN